MFNFIAAGLKFIFKLLLYGLSGSLFLSLILLFVYVKSLPDLDAWHTQILESEYKQDMDIESFEDYLDLEQRVFTELEEKIVKPLPMSGQTRLNRFYKGSLSSPDTFDINWNRSFVLAAPAPKAGVLLLHGMSDSPYSLRSIGQHLNKKGAFVVGLRIPGHGTAPSGLLDVKFEDMAAAVKLSMKYIANKAPGKPLYIIGYSNGGALGLHYALSSFDDPSLEKTSGLVLISPAIGVSKIASLAQFMEKLSKVYGFGKLAWNDILPEYNPYKYNSFATNAGDQVYRLTREINRLLAVAKQNGNLKSIPDILAFQSIVDATVSTSAIVTDLFSKLPKAGHELLIFDINRTFDLTPLMNKDPVPEVHRLFKQEDLAFTVSFITNKSNEDRHVYLRQKKAGNLVETKFNLGFLWPVGLYSLSHVALPFSKEDPLYGTVDNHRNTGLNLGDIHFRGEKGILNIPAAEIIRLKWNPFYPYMENRIFNMVFPID